MGHIGGFVIFTLARSGCCGDRIDQENGDQNITSYRDHGHMLACGMDPKMVMAELTGRSTGYSKGKGDLCTCSQKMKVFMEDTE